MAAPDWLLEALQAAVVKLGWRYGGLDEGGMAVITDDKGEEAKFGLESVERRLAGKPPGDRVELLIAHLRTLRRVRPTSDLAAARERLLVRVRPAFDEADEVGRQVWDAPLGETGLIQVLVVDHPEAMSYVTRDMLEGSGRTGEEWLAFALDNLRAISPRDVVIEYPEGTGVRACGTADAYDAARALILDDLVEEPSPDGYLVSVPGRDRMLFYPVDAGALDGRFAALLIATLEMHAEMPYQISDGIFWVRGGEWEAVGYDYADGELTVELPEGLRDVLEGGDG